MSLAGLTRKEISGFDSEIPVEGQTQLLRFYFPQA